MIAGDSISMAPTLTVGQANRTIDHVSFRSALWRYRYSCAPGDLSCSYVVVFSVGPQGVVGGKCVRVRVLINLHTTPHSGPVILVLLLQLALGLPSQEGINVCVCVSLCVFIKLHITAQSGPVILVVLCHSH